MSDTETSRERRTRSVIVPLVVAIIGATALLIGAIINQGWWRPFGDRSTRESMAEYQRPYADLEREAIEHNTKVAELRQKTPPFGYALTEDCSTSWTNFNGRRVWVKDAKRLSCSETCPWEPLGIYVEEDKAHYYDGGVIREFANSSTIPISEDCFPQLDGACAANILRPRIGQAVTFQVAPYGGSGEYAYTWENGEEESPQFVKSFATAGKKTVTVQITSNGQNVYRTCNVVVDD
jgi:hypothetical protein